MIALLNFVPAAIVIFYVVFILRLALRIIRIGIYVHLYVFDQNINGSIQWVHITPIDIYQIWILFKQQFFHLIIAILESSLKIAIGQLPLGL